MPTSVVERVAAAVLALQALAVAAVVAWELVAFAAGDVAAVPTALALAALTLLAVVALAAFAGATWRGASWGRSGGIVAQLLVLAVALGAVTGTYARPAVGFALAIPAAAELALLVIAVRAAGRRAVA